MLPAAVELIPQIEDILARKAEERAIAPEEYSLLGQFVDRVERRTMQAKEEAAREVDERIAAARAEIPAAAFEMPIDQSGIKEHIFNILTEAGYETVGQLMFDVKTDANKVLGLAGIGSKAMQNIEEVLAVLTFPEPAPAVVEVVAVEETPVVAEAVAETAPAAEMPVGEKPAERKKEAKKGVEEEDDEHAKDGVSHDDLFQMKPEMFQAGPEAEDDSADKKKGKKGKKKGVTLEFDESLGEVVGRKKHKRGEDDGEDW